jgi:Uma2 family endonuclease
MNAAFQHSAIEAAQQGSEGPLTIDADVYWKMAEAGAFFGLPKLELRAGMVYQMNSQAVPHMRAKLAFLRLLGNEIDRLGLPLEVGAEGSVRLSDYDVPEPDICLWDGLTDEGFIPGSSVRLIVEVADTTLAGDLTRKALLYAVSGIAEYWVVDVKAQAVYRMTGPSADGYTARAIFRSGERLDSVTIIGLRIDLPEFR